MKTTVNGLEVVTETILFNTFPNTQPGQIIVEPAVMLPDYALYIRIKIIGIEHGKTFGG